jgi:hypothetical protein
MSSVTVEKPLTRQAWKRRHNEIAAVAQRLKFLLQPDQLVEAELSHLKFLFSPEALRTFAGEIYFHLGPHAYTPADQSTVEADSLAPVERKTDDEIAADETEWDRGVESLEYWLRVRWTVPLRR